MSNLKVLTMAAALGAAALMPLPSFAQHGRGGGGGHGGGGMHMGGGGGHFGGGGMHMGGGARMGGGSFQGGGARSALLMPAPAGDSLLLEPVEVQELPRAASAPAVGTVVVAAGTVATTVVAEASGPA